MILEIFEGSQKSKPFSQNSSTSYIDKASKCWEEIDRNQHEFVLNCKKSYFELIVSVLNESTKLFEDGKYVQIFYQELTLGINAEIQLMLKHSFSSFKNALINYQYIYEESLKTISLVESKSDNILKYFKLCIEKYEPFTEKELQLIYLIAVKEFKNFIHLRNAFNLDIHKVNQTIAKLQTMQTAMRDAKREFRKQYCYWAYFCANQERPGNSFAEARFLWEYNIDKERIIECTLEFNQSNFLQRSFQRKKLPPLIETHLVQEGKRPQNMQFFETKIEKKKKTSQQDQSFPSIEAEANHILSKIKKEYRSIKSSDDRDTGIMIGCQYILNQSQHIEDFFAVLTIGINEELVARENDGSYSCKDALIAYKHIYEEGVKVIKKIYQKCNDLLNEVLERLEQDDQTIVFSPNKLEIIANVLLLSVDDLIHLLNQVRSYTKKIAPFQSVLENIKGGIRDYSGLYRKMYCFFAHICMANGSIYDKIFAIWFDFRYLIGQLRYIDEMLYFDNDGNLTPLPNENLELPLTENTNLVEIKHEITKPYPVSTEIELSELFQTYLHFF